MKPTIEYLPDKSINDEMDLQLRKLLSTCFVKPQDSVFRDRRFFLEPYEHRWVIRSPDGEFVAHAGVHEKCVRTDAFEFPAGGICEVCVHPDFRGRGYVRLLMKQIHAWLRGQGFCFTILFGKLEVYSSSGYSRVDNCVNGGKDRIWVPALVLVCALGRTAWPQGRVEMPGPDF